MSVVEWVVVPRGPPPQVYDVTDFLAQHPGGDQILLDYSGGRDATTVFHLSFHSDAALALMGRYLLWDRDQVLGR